MICSSDHALGLVELLVYEDVPVVVAILRLHHLGDVSRHGPHRFRETSMTCEEFEKHKLSGDMLRYDVFLSSMIQSPGCRKGLSRAQRQNGIVLSLALSPSFAALFFGLLRKRRRALRVWMLA